MGKKKNLTVEKIYKDKTYLNSNKIWHQEDPPYKAAFVKKSIDRNKVSFTTRVDISCGAGRATKILAKHPKSKSLGRDFSNDFETLWD